MYIFICSVNSSFVCDLPFSISFLASSFLAYVPSTNYSSFFKKSFFLKMENYRPNHADVMAVYYDFLPMTHSAKKSFWVQLRDAPPASLKVDTMVKLVSTDPNLKLPLQYFQVLDVIGTRVVLTSSILDEEEKPGYRGIRPFTPQKQKSRTGDWYPLSHGSHWAQATKDWTDSVHSARNWTFGSGESVAYITW